MRPVCRDPQAWRSRLVLFLMFAAVVIVAAMIDEPSAGGHYCGTVAAPVFAAVAQDTPRMVNVAPDAPVGDIIAPLEASDEES